VAQSLFSAQVGAPWSTPTQVPRESQRWLGPQPFRSKQRPVGTQAPDWHSEPRPQSELLEQVLPVGAATQV
jgi:hypothetical protein